MTVKHILLGENFECKYCGHTSSYIVKKISGASIPPIGLYCGHCGKWQKWLNEKELKASSRKLIETKAVKEAVSNVVNYIRYQDYNKFGEIEKATAADYVAKLEATLTDICHQYNIDDDEYYLYPEDDDYSIL